MPRSRHSGSRSRRPLSALRLVLLYVALASVWMVLSNLTVAHLLSYSRQAICWQMVKSAIFVLVTAGLLYLERRWTLRAIRGGQTLYETVAQNDPGGALFLYDQDLRYTFAAGKGLADVGLSKAMLEGKTIHEALPPEVCAQVEPEYRAALVGVTTQKEVVQAGRTYLVSIAPVVGAEGRMGMSVRHDITGLKKAETALRRANRTLRMMIACQEAVILAQNERQLLDGVCRAVVEAGEYRMAWIGYAQEDAERTVRAMAKAGYDAGYVEALRLRWADTTEGRGPTGTAIRTGRPCAMNTFGAEAFAPWREAARERGYRSSLSVPLKEVGRVFGSLSLYAAEENVFAEEEVTLLTRLAEGVSHGILALRSEMALRASEERLRLAVDAADLGTWNWDLAAGRIIWGGHLESLFGLSEGQFGGTYEDFEQRVHPEDRRAVTETLERARDGRTVYEQQFRALWPDGSVHWLLARGEFAYDETGQAVRMAGAAKDITERIRAEQVIRSIARFPAENPSPVLRVDGEGYVLYANQAAEAVIEEWGRVLPKALQDPLHTVRETGAVQEIEQPLRGRMFSWELSAGSERKDVNVYGYDVSDRVRAEREVRQINAELEDRVKERTTELEAANRELEAFSYAVSHDLRAPLRSMSGFAHALMEDYGKGLDEEGRHYLSRIDAAAGRMGHLIDAMLLLSRLSRAEMQRVRVDLSRMATEVVGELREAHGRDGVEAVIAPGLVTEGDPELIRLVLTNLLGNAWKFTGRTPEARVEFGGGEKRGPKRVYYVRDNGMGFDMTYVDRLFTPFQRLHTVEDFGGTGIGLATVRRIVRRHGGDVWAEGAPGRGATFSFTL